MNENVRRIRRFCILTLCLRAGLALLASGGGLPQALAAAAAGNGQGKAAIPDPPRIDLAGYNALLGKYRGKPLLVNFWATWCERCRKEYSVPVKLARQYAAKGLVGVGISFDEDAEMSLVRCFLARNRPAFPNYREKLSEEAAFIRRVNPAWRGSLPSTAFYARNGRLARQFLGARPRAVFEHAIRALLAGPGGGANTVQARVKVRNFKP